MVHIYTVPESPAFDHVFWQALRAQDCQCDALGAQRGQRPCGGSGCALLPWCASARRLQHELYEHAALSVSLYVETKRPAWPASALTLLLFLHISPRVG